MDKPMRCRTTRALSSRDGKKTESVEQNVVSMYKLVINFTLKNRRLINLAGAVGITKCTIKDASSLLKSFI